MNKKKSNKANSLAKLIGFKILIDFLNIVFDSKIKGKINQTSDEEDNIIRVDYNKIKDIINEVVNEKTIKKKQEENEDFEKYGKNLRPSSRVEKKDLMFFSSNSIKIENKFYYKIEGNKFDNHLFIRAIAKGIVFDSVDFSKTIFDSVYLRDCRFVRCNFEGAKFVNSNLHGTYFEDCNFDYVIFEKTFVDDEIFECAPKLNNLKYKFARSLKLNYASIGDYIKASNAVKIEQSLPKCLIFPNHCYQSE